jgi:hypothetical protein
LFRERDLEHVRGSETEAGTGTGGNRFDERAHTVAKKNSPPRRHTIDEATPVLGENFRPFAPGDEQGLAPDRPEGPDRRIDAAHENGTGPCIELR